MRNVVKEWSGWKTPIAGWWRNNLGTINLCCVVPVELCLIYCSSLQVDLFKKTLLLIPIHLEVHWSLITVNIPNRIISFYDSQGIHFKFCVEVRVTAVTAKFELFSWTNKPLLSFICSALNFKCSESVLVLSYIKWESACPAKESEEQTLRVTPEWGAETGLPVG